MFRSLRARLVLIYLAVNVGAMLFLAFVVIDLTRDAYLLNVRRQLTTNSRLLAEIVQPLIESGADGAVFDALAKRLRAEAGMRVTIIRPDGVVLGDSDEMPARMENHANRPEVIAALATGTGEASRYSATLHTDMHYFATLVRRGAQSEAVVRMAVPFSDIEQVQAQITALVIGSGLLVSLGSLVVILYVTRGMTDSIAQLDQVAARLAAGQWHAHAHEGGPQEIARLAATMNLMAERLGANIRTLETEQARSAGILSHMADGLLIVDDQSQVLQANEAAARILNMARGEMSAHTFSQVARDYEMAECLQLAQTTRNEQTRVVEQSGARRFLRMVVTPLQSDSLAPTYLVILQDLTQIRRLETVRRDFISNISHELRTPLAALRALVETLNDGALEDLPAAHRFLAQMEDEVHLLSQLVNDLLDLSAIESGDAPLERKPIDIAAVVRRATERLQPQAERAGVALTAATGNAPVTVLAEGGRIEQVMLNLIHNAIKFTPSGGSVECVVTPSSEQVAVSVRDTGMGISSVDLPRIFERFYKADKARAGGGSGLGLAIARHIVEQHGGRIWAESVEGKGTTIVFTIPGR
jgi:two-component system phosphate regulon sensor histidine kinase PhoR